MLTAGDETTILAHWYAALIEFCNLDPSTFQLAQGGIPVGFTSTTIWDILDSVPPLAINHVYNPAQSNRFSSNYGAVIGTLLDQGSYIVQQAVSMWETAGGFPSTKAYDATIRRLDYAVLSSPAVEFSVDCSAPPPDLRHTWAGSRVSTGRTLLDIPQGAPGPPVTISARFDHMATIVAGPLDHRSQDPEIRDYEPWYLSPAMAMAYQRKTGWGSYPTWESTFGPGGTMLRRCSGLVVADGVRITVRPTSPGDRAALAGRAGGIGALLLEPRHATTPPAPAGATNSLFADQEAATTFSPAGNTLVLGVDVVPAPAYITG